MGSDNATGLWKLTRETGGCDGGYGTSGGWRSSTTVVGGVVMTSMIPGGNRSVIIIYTGCDIREELRVPRYASREETVY